MNFSLGFDGNQRRKLIAFGGSFGRISLNLDQDGATNTVALWRKLDAAARPDRLEIRVVQGCLDAFSPLVCGQRWRFVTEPRSPQWSHQS